MMLGHTNARENEAAYSEQMQRAIAYCRDADVSGIEKDRYPRDRGDFVVLINQCRTGGREGRLPGTHREYAELQYMVPGREYMGFYPNRGDNEVLRDCLEKEDTLYYKENLDSGEVMLPLVPDSYGIFFPENVHRPFCQVNRPEDVKKIVIKIRMSTL